MSKTEAHHEGVWRAWELAAGPLVLVPLHAYEISFRRIASAMAWVLLLTLSFFVADLM